MKMMRFIISVIIAVVFSLQAGAGFNLRNERNSAQLSIQNSEPLQQNERMLQVGEELEYSVHYSFFNIGTVHFKVTDKEERNGREVTDHLLGLAGKNWWCRTVP